MWNSYSHKNERKNTWNYSGNAYVGYYREAPSPFAKHFGSFLDYFSMIETRSYVDWWHLLAAPWLLGDPTGIPWRNAPILWYGDCEGLSHFQSSHSWLHSLGLSQRFWFLSGFSDRIFLSFFCSDQVELSFDLALHNDKSFRFCSGPDGVSPTF